MATARNKIRLDEAGLQVNRRLECKQQSDLRDPCKPNGRSIDITSQIMS